MKKLRAGNGIEFYLSDKDYVWARRHKWHIDSHGYVFSNNYKFRMFPDIKTKHVKLHRLIFLLRGVVIEEYIDHKDGNKLNNTRGNLRIANNQQNQANSKLGKNNTSGYKGVTWDKVNNKWVSQLMFNRKTLKLGRFTNKEDAYEVYCRKAIELFGKYAKI